MREILAVLSIVAALGFATADDVTSKSIAGKWEVVSVTRDGAEDGALKGAVRTHEAGYYKITPAAGSKAPAVSGALAVNEKTTPTEIAMRADDGRYKGETLLGIAKLDGDTLTIAFAEPGKERPKSFESKAGSGIVVAVHKRIK